MSTRVYVELATQQLLYEHIDIYIYIYINTLIKQSKRSTVSGNVVNILPYISYS